MSKRTGAYGIGQESEQIAAGYLAGMGYFVIPISEYTNNTGAMINAPMVIAKDGKLIGPDLLAMKNGEDIWVEVKMKTEPTYFWKRHEWQHGIDAPNMRAYQQVQERTGKKFIIVVHEINSPKTPDLYLKSMEDSSARLRMKSDLQPIEQWLSITLEDAFMFGEERSGNFEMASKQNRTGDGVYWPRSRMTLLSWGQQKGNSA